MRYGRDVIVARNVIPVDTAYGDNKRKHACSREGGRCVARNR